MNAVRRVLGGVSTAVGNWNVEFARVWSNFRNKGTSRLVCDYLIVPASVAAMMLLAYISRTNPEYHATSFVYFGTLYAFWCGLFGSCQIFNGEVSSGEWSYWVLSHRRSVPMHYLAHFALCCLSALFQVLICAVFVLLFAWILPEIDVLGMGSNAHSIGGKLFCMLSPNCGFFQYGKYWSYLWDAKRDFSFALFECSKYLWSAFVFAAISGAVWGLFLSSVLATPSSSLTASVCMIVACTVLSQTSIEGNGPSSSNKREFAPAYLVCNQSGSRYDYTNGTASRWGDGGLLEMVSWGLPQRFFFNLGSLSFRKLDHSLSSDWKQAEHLMCHSQKKVAGCLCPACVGLISVSAGPGETFTVDDHLSGMSFDSESFWTADDFYPTNSPNVDKSDSREFQMILQSHRRVYSRIAHWEMFVLILQMGIMMFLTGIVMRFRAAFWELR